MTILYADDFESYSSDSVPSGWVNATGENGWRVYDLSDYAISGSKAMIAPGMSDGYTCVYKGVAARQSVDYLISQRAKFNAAALPLQSICHAEGTNPGGNPLGSSAYRVVFTSSASSVTASLVRWDGSTLSSQLASGNRTWSVSADNTIKLRLRVDGLTVSVWAWNSSNESMPIAPLLEYTDSAQRAAGFFGVSLNNAGNTTLTSFDDIAISDISTGAVDAVANGGTGAGIGSGSGGNATGESVTSASATGGTGTGTGSGSGGGAAGTSSGSFTSSPMYSSGIMQASVALSWTWYPGAIGVTPTASLVHGSGTTSAGGTLTASGLPTGAGFLLAKTTDGAIYYEAGTVA